jgi:hypothetical protein
MNWHSTPKRFLSKLSTIESAVEIDDLSFEIRVDGNLTQNDLPEIKRTIEAETSEGDRALKAIKEIQISKISRFNCHREASRLQGA